MEVSANTENNGGGEGLRGKMRCSALELESEHPKGEFRET